MQARGPWLPIVLHWRGSWPLQARGQARRRRWGRLPRPSKRCRPVFKGEAAGQRRPPMAWWLIAHLAGIVDVLDLSKCLASDSCQDT